MKKFTKISLILCAVLAGAGILFCIVSMSLGFGFGQFADLVGDGAFSLIWTDSGLHWGNDVEEGNEYREGEWTRFQETWEKAEARNLDIEYRWGTLVIEPSESNAIEAEVSYRKEGEGFERAIKLELEGDTLKVTDDFTKKNFWILRPNGDDATLTLRIPAEMAFDDVKLDVDAAEVELSTVLSCEKLDLEIGAGAFSDSGEGTAALRAEEMKLEVGAGAMSLSEVWTHKLEATCGVGQMELGKVTAVDTALDCGVGEILMSMTGRQGDYDYEVDTGVGSVSVGESEYNGLGTSQKVDNGAVNFIKIDCGVGSIDISFME